jgi:hypothetical protein
MKQKQKKKGAEILAKPSQQLRHWGLNARNRWIACQSLDLLHCVGTIGPKRTTARRGGLLDRLVAPLAQWPPEIAKIAVDLRSYFENIQFAPAFEFGGLHEAIVTYWHYRERRSGDTRGYECGFRAIAGAGERELP